MEEYDQKLVRIFIDESREHLTGIEDDLLAIEGAQAGEFRELTDRVFRAVHTIKGSAGIFSFDRIRELSHGMENILGALREGKITPDRTTISILLDCADTLKMQISNINESNSVDISDLLSRLRSIEHHGSGRSVSPKPDCRPMTESLEYTTPVFGLTVKIDTAAARAVKTAQPHLFFYCIEIDSTRDAVAQLQTTDEILSEIDSISSVFGRTVTTPETDPSQWRIAVVCGTSLLTSIIAELLQLPAERIHTIRFCQDTAPDGKPCPDKPESEPVEETDPERTSGRHPDHHDESPPPKMLKNNLQSQSLRVNITTLDRLMTLAGEMVLTRNELLQSLPDHNRHRMQSVSQKVDSITTELQEAIMSTRMLSLKVVLNRFRRFSRDIALQLGKQITLDIKGEEVELDKSIVEAIGDPLTHIVRNAIDHGIEMPDERIIRGKSAYGTLQIAASQEGGQVLIEIMDDGKGIDPAVIRAKAKQSGLVHEATLTSMSDAEVIKLIFRPGFSTAEQVTDMSGRGVGMDVVQNNLKNIGGAIDIHSVPGEGTTFRIKLPLTLAIIPALLISVEDEQYAIAQSSIEELVRIPAVEVRNRLKALGSSPVLRLRGILLPLIRLSDILGIKKTYIEKTTNIIRSDRRKNISDRRADKNDETEFREQRHQPDRRTSHASALNIVVVAAGDFRYGIIVDQLLDSAEIVVKPLGSHFSECREYAGATILGDGHVALILDVIGIRRLVEMKRTSGTITFPEASSPDSSENPVADTQPLLLVENGTGEFFAIPIGLITRIERIPSSSVSSAGGRKVINYRQSTLRLLSIEEVIDVGECPDQRLIYIVIMQAGGHEVGIIASDIIDTVDIPDSSVDCVTHTTEGVLGSTFVNDSFTLILDLFGMVRKAAPELLIRESNEVAESSPGRILIIEDSVFFRRQICSFIEDAGFETVCRENGAQGLSFLQSSEEHIDLVLTDIEMPEMNGFEFTRALRLDERFNDMPVIAITSMSGEEILKKGSEAGVDACLEKFEREVILQTCIHHIELHRNKETV